MSGVSVDKPISATLDDCPPDTRDGLPSNRRHGSGCCGRVQYRWCLFVFVFIFNTIGGLIFTSTSVLYAEYIFHFKASQAEVGLSVSIHMAMLYLSGIFLSGPLKVFGGRPVAFVGGLLLVFGFLLSSLASSIYYLYITQGVLTGLGNSMTETTSYLMIQQHFTEHRALAAGIASLGSNMGNLIAPILMQSLIDAYGWRGALVIFSGILAHLIPLSLTFRQPRGIKQTPTDDTETETKSDEIDVEETQTNDAATNSKSTCTRILHDICDFSLLKKASFAFFCLGGGFLYRFNHIGFVQHFTSRSLHVGVDKQTSAYYLSLFFAVATATRLFIAFIGNLRFVSVQIIYTLGVAFATLANVLMVSLPSIYGPLLSAISFGFSVGFANTVFPVVLVELHGAHNIARSLAIFYFILGFGALVGTPFMGLMSDVTGSYDVPYYINSILAATGTLLCLLMFILEQRSKRAKRAEITKNT